MHVINEDLIPLLCLRVLLVLLYQEEENDPDPGESATFKKRQVTINDIAKKNAKGVLMTRPVLATVDWDQEKRKLKDMIQYSTEKNILKCRGSQDAQDIKHYKTFCEYVLVGMRGINHFRDCCPHMKICDIYSVEDEAFAALLLENNASDLLKIQRDKKRIGPKNANTKFTKNKQGDRGTSGWKNTAVKKLMENIKVVKAQRLTRESVLLDEGLFEDYCGLMGLKVVDDEDHGDDESGDDNNEEEDNRVFYQIYDDSGDNGGNYGIRSLTTNMSVTMPRIPELGNDIIIGQHESI